MKKNILVTGGTGFVGANLLHRLVKEGYEPTVLVRKESNTWRIREILNKIKIVESDLQNIHFLSRQVKKIRPTHIFHLAIYGAQQAVQKDMIQTYTQNILSGVNLMEACCRCGFEQYVNVGSSSEYGIKNSAMKENNLLEPINHYGVSKAAITLATSVFSDTYKLPLCTVRLFSPYGAWEDKSRLIPLLIQSAIRGKIVKLSNPSNVRDFIFISDVVAAFMCILNSKMPYNDMFNIGSGQQYSLKEVVDIVNTISDGNLKVKWNSHRVNQKEPSIWKADISKIKKTIHWKPTTTLKQGLNKTYQWMLLNKELYEAQ